MGKIRSTPSRTEHRSRETAAWVVPSRAPALADGQVHVWSVALAVAPAARARLAALLADDETQRAARFRSSRDADRYLVARGTLRELLAGYAGVAAPALRFSYGERGKPALAAAAGAGLHFNVAHAADRALVAVSRAAPIGVDLEEIAAMPDLDKVAATHFSPSERRQLAALRPDERLEGFFTAWTRKEAYVKALGDGLAAALDRFSVSLHPDEPARLLSIEGDAQAAARWTLEHLEPARGFVGALAVPAAVQVRRFAWAAME